jgi:hypothetical protein
VPATYTVSADKTPWVQRPGYLTVTGERSGIYVEDAVELYWLACRHHQLRQLADGTNMFVKQISIAARKDNGGVPTWIPVVYMKD